MQKNITGKLENLAMKFNILSSSECHDTLRKNTSQNMLTIASKQKGLEVDMYLLNVKVFSLILFMYVCSCSIKLKPAWKHSLKVENALLVYVF